MDPTEIAHRGSVDPRSLSVNEVRVLCNAFLNGGEDLQVLDGPDLGGSPPKPPGFLIS